MAAYYMHRYGEAKERMATLAIGQAILLRGFARAAVLRTAGLRLGYRLRLRALQVGAIPLRERFYSLVRLPDPSP